MSNAKKLHHSEVTLNARKAHDAALAMGDDNLAALKLRIQAGNLELRSEAIAQVMRQRSGNATPSEYFSRK